MPVKVGDTIDPEATRRRILKVSERIFYDRGIGAVGVAEIARAAVASKASIYKNFGSKEGLVEATLEYRSGRVHEWLANSTAAAESGRDRILRVFDLLLEWFQSDDFHGCAMVSAAAEERVTGGAATRLARQHLQKYRDFLSTELAHAGFPDASERAQQLLILIEGATTVSAIDHDPAAAQVARRVAAQILGQAHAT
ncbi:MAG TPA: TetR/AcrR family transcriptional regulator [Gemmatimonadales bacterium]|jgi:AcrR family transcriptional regulator|nr:TetR/AcrR family transcriptional regulator [Gemmatimonadales bacterium]